jgi:hypothetical protein
MLKDIAERRQNHQLKKDMYLENLKLQNNFLKLNQYELIIFIHPLIFKFLDQSS